MYKDHVPVIAKAMRNDVPTFCRGVMFSVLSARVQFPRVPAQCKELARAKDRAQCLWGFKFKTYAYVVDNANTLYGTVAHEPDTERALWAITRAHGLGLVKGAFVLQLLGHDIACIDYRNATRDGHDPGRWHPHGDKSSRAFRNKLTDYCAEYLGKAEYYWDTWCTEVAQDYGLTAQGVSRMHMTSIVPRSKRNVLLP